MRPNLSLLSLVLLPPPSTVW